MTDKDVRFTLSPASRRLISEYAEALRSYLRGAERAALARAYDVGLRALAQGADVLEIAAIHHQAMAEIVLQDLPAERRDEAMRAMEVFCSACPASREAASSAVPVAAVWTVLSSSLAPAAEDHGTLKRVNLALRRISEMREEEARRIAHALHDDAAQLVAAAHLDLEEAAVAAAVSPEQFDAVRRRLDEIGERLRTLSHELRPTVLDDFGLIAALEMLAHGVERRSGVQIVVSGDASRRLPATVESALYRMVQECLRNVARHARARRATVTVQTVQGGNGIRCVVSDDGSGFDTSSLLEPNPHGGLGLIGIRERAAALGGTVEIVSAPGQGTSVSVSLPIGHDEKESPPPTGNGHPRVARSRHAGDNV